MARFVEQKRSVEKKVQGLSEMIVWKTTLNKEIQSFVVNINQKKCYRVVAKWSSIGARWDRKQRCVSAQRASQTRIMAKIAAIVPVTVKWVLHPCFSTSPPYFPTSAPHFRQTHTISGHVTLSGSPTHFRPHPIPFSASLTLFWRSQSPYSSMFGAFICLVYVWFIVLFLFFFFFPFLFFFCVFLSSIK